MNMMARDNKIREGNYMEKVPFPDSIVTFIKRRPKANEPHGDNKFYYSNPQQHLAKYLISSLLYCQQTLSSHLENKKKEKLFLSLSF